MMTLQIRLSRWFLAGLFLLHGFAGSGSSVVFAFALFGSVPGHTRADASAPTVGSSSSSSSSSNGLAAASSPKDALVESNTPVTELPPDFPRTKDVLVALEAVRQACRITQALQPLHGPQSSRRSSDRDGIVTVEKADLSPVTVADYAVQARILHTLHQQFPNDGFIAEESTEALRDDPDLCRSVVTAATLTEVVTLEVIDLGRSFTTWNTTNPRPKRVWCLDPIDGTKGFLRGKHSGGQYCIALSLLEDGVAVIGILGCPNLPLDDTGTDDSDNTANDNQPYGAWSEDELQVGSSDILSQKDRGCIFVASRGGGCYQLPLTPPIDSTAPSSTATVASTTRGPLHVTPNQPSLLDTRPVTQGRFCIGVERFSDALGQMDAMADLLQEGGLLCTRDGTETTSTIRYAIRMDSQAKHGIIARGGAEWYVRLPKPGYREYIWDHAAGFVVVTEAGGIMTDTRGQALDFSLGHQLDASVKGILMSSGGEFHTALLSALKQVVNQQQVH